MLILLLLCSIVGFAQACKAGKNCQCIESTPGNYVRAWKGPESKDDWYLDIAPHCLDNEHWLINAKNGKLSLKSDDGMYLLAYPNGTVYLSKSASEPEMWETEHNDGGYWSFHADGRWLSAHRRDNTVETKPHNRNWERFRVHALELFDGLSTTTTAGPTDPTDTTTTETITTSTTPKPITASSAPKQVVPVHTSLGKRRIRSAAYKTYLRAYGYQLRSITVDMLNGPPRMWERWDVQEAENGTVVFRAIHSPDRYLSGRPNGTVELVGHILPWEYWTPYENSDGSWSFLSSHGQYLRADKEGKVTTVEKCEGPETHFFLEFWTDLVLPPSKSPQTLTAAEEVAGQRRFLSVAHGTYLLQKAPQWVEMGAMGACPDKWLIEESKGKVVIKTIDEPVRYLRAPAEGVLNRVTYFREWEHWTPVKNPCGSFSFQSAHGRWLSVGPNGTVVTGDFRGVNEEFWMEPGN